MIHAIPEYDKEERETIAKEASITIKYGNDDLLTTSLWTSPSPQRTLSDLNSELERNYLELIE